MKKILFLIGVTLSLVACNAELSRITLQSPKGEQTTLFVERAMSDEERTKGLMHREMVTHGMLFIFENEQPLNFWMKDMLVPLDIIYFDGKGNFVSSKTMAPCEKDPCATYPSARPAMYALEMPAGFLAENPIGKNWKILP